MKKYLLILSCTALLGFWSCGTISVDEENSGSESPDNPDKPGPEEDLFEAYLLQHFDTDGDGKISTREADAVIGIDCSDMNIKELTGIDRFRNLTSLICSYNDLTSLDLSRNRVLKILECSVNSIARLNLSGCAALEKLHCNRNALTLLDLSACGGLLTLDCAENSIAELDVSGCLQLDDLDCKGNSMTSVWLLRGQTVSTIKKDAATVIRYKDMPTDAFQLYLLEQFDANGDKALSEAEMNLVTEIHCSGRSFTTLTGLGQFANLRKLNCSGCELSSLDLTECSALTSLDCSNNRLTVLDVSKNRSLAELDCRQNTIAELWLEWTQVIETCQKDATAKVQFYNKPDYFAIGDWYDDGEGLRGIVFKGGYNYSKKKLLALKNSFGGICWAFEYYDTKLVGASSTTDGAVNMAAARKQSYFDKLPIFTYAAGYGEGWYPLAKEEVQAVLDNLTKINEGLNAYGGRAINSEIMTSSETTASTVWAYSRSSTPNWSSNNSKQSSITILFGHTF